MGAFLQRRWRLLLGLAVALAVVNGVVNFVIRPLIGGLGRYEDFQAYWEAARWLLTGHALYAPQAIDVSVVFDHFLYPPFAAVVVAPFGLLPHAAAQILWLWLEATALGAGMWFLLDEFLPAGWPRRQLTVVATLAFFPATYNLFLGQINCVLFLCMVLGMRWLRREHDTRAGMILGFAAAIKLAPIVMLVVLVGRRRWGASAAMAATAAACSLSAVFVVGWQTTWMWVTAVLPLLGRPNGWVYNQTLNGVWSRFFDHSVLAFSPDALWLRAGIACSGVAVLAGLYALARRTSRLDIRDAYAMGIGAMLVAGTIAWYSHYVSASIVLVAAAAWAIKQGQYAVIAAVFVEALILEVLIPWMTVATTTSGLAMVSGTPWYWALLQIWSLPTIALVTVMGAYGVGLWRQASVGRSGAVARATKDLADIRGATPVRAH
ncbi:MAG: glycosyltransferase family 87 protein [Candidatus Dormibacteria bacterium]